MISSIGKGLVAAGLILAGLGLVLLAAGRFAWLRALWARFPLGRLPGDIRLEGDGFFVSFPWVTCLAISLGLSLAAWIFRK
jgi:hypothetical protein